MRKSIRIKLIALTSLVLTLSIVLISVLSIRNFTNNTVDLVYSKTEVLSSGTATQIDMKLEELEYLVKSIGASPFLLDVLTDPNADRDAAYRFLASMQSSYSDLLDSVILVDTDKQGIMSSTSKDLALDLSDREYLIEASKGHVATSEVIISKTTGHSIIAIASPIKKDDTTVGYIVSSIDFSNIRSITNAVQVFEGGHSYIFDHTGLVVAHTLEDYVGERNVTTLNSAELSNMVEETKQGNHGHVLYTLDGIKKYVSYYPVSNWGVAVEIDHADYMKTTTDTTLRTVIVALIMILIANIIIYFFASRTIIKPIIAIERAMKKAGHGDLTIQTQVSSQDEIGHISASFNSMIMEQKTVLGSVTSNAKNLHHSTDEISFSSVQVSEASTIIAKNSSELANVADTQNNAISNVAQLILQLSSLIELAKARAIAATDNIDASLSVAELGRTNVENTLTAINTIKENTIITNNSLAEVEELSSQISGVVNTINGIASQTNLLALNASIEAARAGEHGKGFSVVAEEVRKLAEQTASEANQISAVISEMTTKINEVVEAMTESQSSVESGVERAEETDESLLNILETFRTVTDDIAKIQDITKDEVVNSDEIIRTIDTIGKLSDQNNSSAQDIAASVEEQTALLQNISASSEEINGMAEELNEMVRNFKVE